MWLAGVLFLPLALAVTPSIITIYTCPIHSARPDHSSLPTIPTPTPLAQITFDASTSLASLKSYTPPTGAYTPSHLLRVGLYDPATSEWKGVVASAASFANEYQKKLILHVDETGDVYHVGLATSGRSKTSLNGDSKGKGTGVKMEEIDIEVVERTQASQPALNKPIVLNSEGRLEGKEPEKTFLQKYWWVLALFLLVQFVSAGGDSK
ncbi:hypothetical protein AOQ84DRAFT_287525 [Glonium stellatum]|uniref:ER membrane protein complex subunit 10 n=1 Tax=Glonium stellatum TaxID=574774 RepID=A0A8E2F680_9PEZI|nr:hypothetical protein AOQ84DRAFT_287525 [Glonium stellatum]